MLIPIDWRGGKVGEPAGCWNPLVLWHSAELCTRDPPLPQLCASRDHVWSEGIPRCLWRETGTPTFKSLTAARHGWSSTEEPSSFTERPASLPSAEARRFRDSQGLQSQKGVWRHQATFPDENVSSTVGNASAQWLRWLILFLLHQSKLNFHYQGSWLSVWPSASSSHR